MSPQLPVIDVTPLLEGDSVRSRSTIKDISSALKDLGVFYATGHGISQERVRLILQHTRDFFNLSQEKKARLSYKKNEGYRGYLHFGSEQTAGQVDVKEGMLFGSECQNMSLMYGHNVFPEADDIPTFKEDIVDFMDSLNELGKVISRAFFMEFEAGDSFFKSAFNPPFYIFNLWHYPSNSDSSKFGIGQHTDYEAFTFLLQDDVGGLQVQKKDGSWIDVPPIQGTVLVMIGDAIESWTKGLYKAPVHRVKNTTSQSRYSMAFFFQPNLETVIKPMDIPEILKRNFVPTRKDIKLPYHYGQQLYKNYCQSFGVIEHAVDSTTIQ
ncbi:probable iron/ascorbate oxidoreductase DDB_G0283291 [Exaiptasia diaphana]|uniref:Fe2OG dioxygenase domain-containing protein n=1 Tax=Exaiptasia diaphana TaxID=2652724 RepID=A0A913X2F4_EXADI|nr:probable iron/ascorbate oxidoreductase DDB_G0283291 [Exaiptasia diaphana]KXJ27410.1 putative iron/ascorbate oxidoreductase [Exaiptasia diaphana]